MAKRTPDPRQLLLAFDAPIAVVVELRPSAPVAGMPVHLVDGGRDISVTHGDDVIGFVDGRQYPTLSKILRRFDCAIDPVVGQIDDRAFEVIVVRTTDDGTFRNVVRCVRAEFAYQSAA